LYSFAFFFGEYLGKLRFVVCVVMYLKKSALRLPLHLPPILCSFIHTNAHLSYRRYTLLGPVVQSLHCVYVFRSSSRTFFFFLPLTLVLLPACFTSCFCRSPFSSKTNSRSLAAQPVDIHTHTHTHTHTHSLSSS